MTLLRVKFGDVLAWSVIYTLLLILPLLVAYAAERPPGRGFWIEFGVALGFVGMAMMGLQFVLTARFRKIAPPFGTDTLLQFHRQIGILALLFILAHPAILFIADRRYLVFLDPSVNLARTLSLGFATIALVAIVVLSLWRKGFGLSYEWWRLTHGILALLVVMIGLAHILMVGHYVEALWKQALWTAVTVVPMYLLVHVRVVRPWIMSRKPWRVTEVKHEAGRVWTLVVEPDGHAGKRFRAGQFMWLTLQNTPWSLQQHPFSISSSEANPERLEFTIKELGDFTSTAKDTPSGARAFLEGPFGRFILDEQFGGGLVFIAGGIGVTPMMSILRTLRDRGDQRPLILIYGNNRREKIAFRDELDEMRKQMNLKLIYVLEEAPEQWEGEVGWITAELLDRHLPGDNRSDWHYYICGPDPMMDIAEAALMARNVPLWNVYTERFEMV
jgi:predicted ferric reductase